MAIKYPAQIDVIPKVQDGLTPITGTVYNRLRDSTIAVEQELGAKPSGVYGTVRTRLDYLEGLLNQLHSSTHNALLGIQGGSAYDGYYHLTQAEHTWLVDGYITSYWQPIYGGTGLTSYVLGDLLYASAPNTLSNLPAGAVGDLLTISGGVPAWIAPSATFPSHNNLSGLQGGSVADGYYHLTNSEQVWLTDGYDDGYWNIDKGGTSITTYTKGDILYSSNNNILSKLPIGGDGYVLSILSGLPSWTDNKDISGGFSNVIYVDKNGNDATAERGNIARPCSTIAQAISLAQAGDVIFVGPGTFTGSITFPEIASLSIIGSGIKSTFIVGDTTTALTINPSTTIITNCTLANFSIESSTGSNTAISIDGTGVTPTGIFSGIVGLSYNSLYIENVFAGVVGSTEITSIKCVGRVKISNSTFNDLQLEEVNYVEFNNSNTSYGFMFEWDSTATLPSGLTYGRFIGNYSKLDGSPILFNKVTNSTLESCMLSDTTISPTQVGRWGGSFFATSCNLSTVNVTKTTVGVSASFSNSSLAGLIVTNSFDANLFTVNATHCNIPYGMVVPNANCAVNMSSSGSTGQYSYATGDIIYASAPDTLSKLTVGTQGQVLSVGAADSLYWNTPLVGYTDGYGTALGIRTGATGTTDSTLIGSAAGGGGFGGNYRTALGDGALYYPSGTYNTAVGVNALYGNVTTHTAGFNTAIGHKAGWSVTSGNYNTFVGEEAGPNVSTGTANVMIGDFAGQGVTTSSNNICIGEFCAKTANPADSIFIGIFAGRDSSSTYSLYMGNSSGYNPDGTYNIGIGHNALYGDAGTTTANSNIAIGYQSGYSVSSAANNIILGTSAGYSMTTTAGSVVIGQEACYFPVGDYNIALGYKALYGNTTTKTAYNNVALGKECLYKARSAYNNIGLGTSAGYNITTGIENIAIGNGSSASVATGTYNIHIGYQADGYEADPNYSIAIGYQTKAGSGTDGYTDCIALGREAKAYGGDGAIQIGRGINNRVANYTLHVGGAAEEFMDGPVYTAYIGGSWLTMSDERLKKDILPLNENEGLKFIESLNPVSYKLKNPSNELTERRQFGLIAQQVKQSMLDSGITDELGLCDNTDSRMWALSYDKFVSPLIKAVQELSDQVKSLQKQIDELKK